jgi:hypothetical protein
MAQVTEATHDLRASRDQSIPSRELAQQKMMALEEELGERGSTELEWDAGIDERHARRVDRGSKQLWKQEEQARRV